MYLRTRPIGYILLLLSAAGMTAASAPSGPAWIRDEGIVGASAMEALTFILRRGGDSAEAVRLWKDARSEEEIRRLKDLGANFVVINFHKGAGLKAEAEDIAVCRDFVERAHRHGLKVAGYIGGTLMYETLLLEEPGALDWRQVDEFGRPIYYQNEQTFRYMACRNNPAYIDFLHRVIRTGIQDIKLDLIHFDQMMWWTRPDSCSCRYCREQFRAFLQRRYGDPARARLRFGFTDFREVIPPPYGPDAPPVRFPELRNPMMQEWALFRAASIARIYGELVDYIRSLNPAAGAIANPTMNQESNAGFLYGVDPGQLFEYGDGFWSEEPNLAEWTSDGRLVSQIRSYKAARAMGKPLICWMNLLDLDSYARAPLELRLAETLAYNDASMGIVAGSDTGRKSFRPVIRDYVNFFTSQRKQLVHTESVADAAVLRSFASTQFNPGRSNFATVLYEQSLIQGKIPFGLIYDRHLRDLARYKVLVLADQDALSDDHVEAIRTYVRNGGGLVATEDTSLLTDWRTRREKFGLADLFGLDTPPERGGSNTPIRRRYGQGRVVYIPRVEPATERPSPQMTSRIVNRYWRLPKNHADLLEAVRWAAGGQLSVAVDAPDSVTMELARQRESNTWLLHLINFNIARPVEGVQVSFRVPDGFQLREALAEKPAQSKPEPLAFTVRNGIASLRLPRLDVYALILLRVDQS